MKHRSFFPNLKIKWKIFLYFVFFALLMLTVLWLMQTVFIEDFYSGIKMRQMRNTANAVISSNMVDLDNYAESGDSAIIVLDRDYSLISQGMYFKNGYIFKINPQTAQFINNIASSNHGEAFIEIEDKMNAGQNVPKRMLYAKLFDKGKMVLVEAVFSSLSSTIEIIRIQLTFAVGVFIIIGLIFAVIVSKYTAKPIEKLTQSAKSLAAGNYSADFEASGYSEINELSKTLKIAAFELSKTDNYRRELIANVSHDLRTPLTMIKGYAEAMRDIPGELSAENVQIIIDETDHLNLLVNDLLDLSKIQSGSHMLNKVKYNFTASLKKLLKRYNKLVEQDGYCIEFFYDGEVFVSADEPKITQVTYNLINNAINYTGEDKKITIRQIIDGEKVRIEIKDTGTGIDEGQLTDIWDRYYKIDNVHKRSKQGTGIGLSIVKGIMELHNERYGVSSKIGEGSIFWFELTLSE